jgi:hypothetical protein
LKCGTYAVIENKMNGCKAEIWLRQKWGDDLPEQFVQAPAIAVLTEHRPAWKELRRAEIQVRVRESTCAILAKKELTADARPLLSFLVFDQGVAYTRQLLLQDPCDRYALIDFLVAEDKLVCLLQTAKKGVDHYLLVKQEHGEAIGEWPLEIPQGKTYFEIRRLFENYGRLFVECKEGDRLGLYAIGADGVLELVYESKHAYGIFPYRSGELIVARSSEDHTHNFWTKIDLTTKKEMEKTAPGLSSLHIAVPLFVDDAGHGYGTSGRELTSISLQDGSLWRLSIDHLVPAKGKIYTSSFESSKGLLHVDDLDSGKTTGKVELTIPEPYHPASSARLASLLPDGTWIVAVKKTPDAETERLAFSAPGVFQGKNKPGQKNSEYQLQTVFSWQVDGKGNIYLPVAGPDEFYLVKVSILQTE